MVQIRYTATIGVLPGHCRRLGTNCVPALSVGEAGVNDERLVEAEAEAMIRRLGAEASNFCREQAELAGDQRDELAAEAWHDIADAAERLIKAGRFPVTRTPVSDAAG